MKKLFFLSCLLFFLLTQALAQSANPVIISGKVRSNPNNDPVPATIRIKNSVKAVAADSNGVFKINVPALPAILVVSATGYEQQELSISSNEEISIQLSPRIDQLVGVVLSSKGTPTGVLNAPFSAEWMGISKIRNLPAVSAYDAIVYMKGVDQTSSSATFKTPSTRGFNGSGSTRVNQLVDGMDNQAPGLNFFVGNFAGLTELDIESVELLPGASSALYGPGGMNGTILINSKSPFKYQGLSFQARQGIMHVDKSQRANVTPYYDYSARWAHVFNNRFGVKISAQYLSAQDWLANDSTNYSRNGTSGKLIPGDRNSDPNYDGVNVYGDETSVDLKPFLAGASQQDPFLPAILAPFLSNPMFVSRTGYHEKDIIDPETKNIKLSGALHYKLSDKLEAIMMGYWATGNTVYTDDNRYSLKGIKIGQYKLELKHKDWFLRSFTTQEDAGEAYSATVTTQLFNEGWKRSFNPANIPASWYPQYTQAFVMGAVSVFQPAYVNALNNGQTQAQAIAAGQAAVVNASRQLHQSGRAFADRDRPLPGSQQFNDLFGKIRTTPIPNGGLFKEKSQLWMTEGQYHFSQWERIADIIVGASLKKYVLDSDGTLFIDTAGAIRSNEIGGYVQVTKKMLGDALTLTASGRIDKNENFKGQFTPRVAALIRLAKDNNLRLSYQSAYRFPGNLSQWIRLDVGGDYILLGGLPWVKAYMGADKSPVYQIGQNGPGTTPYEFKEFKPETMRSFEIGYKGLIQDKLLLDAYYYFGKYEDFLGRIGLYQPANGQAYSIVVNSDNKVSTHGFGMGMEYRMKKNFSTFFNLYSDVITDVPANFKSYFNAPKYRLNAGFGNSGMGKSKRIGFNAMMRWQDAFEWEGELANGPIKSFTTVDAQVNYKFLRINSQFRLGGTNIFNKYYQNAYGNPRIGGLYYVSFIHNL